MAEYTPLERYLTDGDAFARHVMQFPALADQVNTLLMVTEQLKESVELTDLMVYRDAVYRLASIAYAEGFLDTASVFEQSYQTTCLLLLTAWAGGN